MSRLFKKKETEVKEEPIVTLSSSPVTATIKADTIKIEPIPQERPAEEWIWVEGYKGTPKDMKCHDYQYELGVQHDMPEGVPVVVCDSGFHLCLELKDVFNFYGVGDGNRFFKVKALVRKKDYEAYTGVDIMIGISFYCDIKKLVAKSIIFESELTPDEVLNHTEGKDLPEKYKKLAMEKSLTEALARYQLNTLVEDGYSAAFAGYVVKKDKFDAAHAVAAMSDLSLDMKVLFIVLN